MLLISLIVVAVLAVAAAFWIRRQLHWARIGRYINAAGMLPEDQQVTDRTGPDPEGDALREAVSRGEWRAAAEALAAAGTDWERRYEIVATLAEAAAEDDAWLRAWRAEFPDDPGAAVVHADAKISLAWEIRGSARANRTTAEQFAGFHRVLGEAREDFARAVALADPADPTPYAAQIPLYMGTGAPHEAMGELWAEITARAPHHYQAHKAALQYWCAKWRGSEELAREFTARAVAAAPPGSLLTVLPLISWYEHKDSAATKADYRSPELTALVDAALHDVAAARPGHPRAAGARHLLAYFLTRQGRHEAAVAQFRVIDGYVGAFPWTYSTDPAEFFCAVRTQALAGAATSGHRNPGGGAYVVPDGPPKRGAL
ncbi:hypothetical protein ACGFLS_17530 [Streptomyces abikoensis]|uniref:hypothetical protein n=1 Tax=Streptomyces abikoensis TaxID=97398 RepID=UPI003715CB25